MPKTGRDGRATLDRLLDAALSPQIVERRRRVPATAWGGGGGGFSSSVWGGWWVVFFGGGGGGGSGWRCRSNGSRDPVLDRCSALGSARAVPAALYVMGPGCVALPTAGGGWSTCDLRAGSRRGRLVSLSRRRVARPVTLTVFSGLRVTLCYLSTVRVLRSLKAEKRRGSGVGAIPLHTDKPRKVGRCRSVLGPNLD